MAKRADPIQIPLPEDEALLNLLKVKPIADMPRPGATGTKKAVPKPKKVKKNG